MNIDETIKRAVALAQQKLPGGFAEIGRRCNLSKASISRMHAGKSDSIENNHWESMWKVLVPHAPDLRAPQYLPQSELLKLAAQHPASDATSTDPPHKCMPEGLPTEVVQMVDQWGNLSDDDKSTLISVIRMALKKYSPRAAPLPQPCREQARKLA